MSRFLDEVKEGLISPIIELTFGIALSAIFKAFSALPGASWLYMFLSVFVFLFFLAEFLSHGLVFICCEFLTAFILGLAGIYVWGPIAALILLAAVKVIMEYKTIDSD